MAGTETPVECFRQFFREHRSVASRTAADTDRTRSLVVDWHRLAAFDAKLAERFLDHPDAVAGYAREALREMSLEGAFGDEPPALRFRNLDTDTKPDALAAAEPGRFVSVSGVVEATTAVRPSLTVVAVECRHCGTTTTGRYFGLTTPELGACRSCGRDDGVPVPADSACVDTQYARLRVGSPHDGDDETIHLRLDGPLQPVTPGRPVTVTGVVRPCGRAELDRRPTVATRFLDCSDIVTREVADEPTPLPDPWTLGDLAARPTYLPDVADAVAPSVPGFRRAKLLLALGYVEPAMPGSDGSGPNVLLLAPDDDRRRRLLEASCELAPGARYRRVCQGDARPVAADVRRRASNCWVETGPLVQAAGRLAAVDAVETVPETQRPRLKRALTAEPVRIAKGGIEVELDTCDRLVATAAPTTERPDDCRAAAPLGDDVVAAFDLRLADSADATASRETLTRAWVEGGDTVPEAETVGRPATEVYRAALTQARSLARPQLTDGARQRLHEIHEDSGGQHASHAVVTWLATALARLRGRDRVRPSDADRAERVAAVLVTG